MKLLDEVERAARDGQAPAADVLRLVAAYRGDLEMMRATEADLAGMHRRVAEIEALVDAGARIIDSHFEKLETMLPVWRALSDGQRLELMALCCSSCGALDPSCQYRDNDRVSPRFLGNSAGNSTGSPPDDTDAAS